MDRANNNSNTKRINFKQILIYYFSGTGNSRRIAEWMAECAYGIAHVINIENINRSSPISINPGSLLGIIFPTFGFAPPWIVIKFAVRLPRIKNCTSFIVASRGTTFQHGSFFISGLAGMNYYLIALILLIKGYRIKGLMGVDMPQYIIQYLIPVFSKKNTEIILSRAKIKAQEFIYKILLQKSHIINYDNIKEFVLGSALLPASIFYLVFVNFISAKLFYASNKCKGCNLCMKHCPVSAIIMRGKKNPRPYWTFKCETCMRCINNCPYQAIEVSYPLAIGAWYIGSSVILAFLLQKLIPIMPWIYSIKNSLPIIAGKLFHTGIFFFNLIIIFFIFYIIFHYIIRIPFINMLFTILTPVHYFRRDHEPNTKLNDFKKDK